MVKPVEVLRGGTAPIYTDAGHVLIEMKINDNNYLTEANFDNHGEVYIREAEELIDDYFNKLNSDSIYSYIGIAVPRR